MKIGILTFHRAHNYGAVLQAYALQEELKFQGHTVEIIDYISFVNGQSIIKNFFRRRNVILLMLNFIFKFYRTLLRHKKFTYFIENRLELTKKLYTPDKLIEFNYDIYVIGSDQLWNRRITKGFDQVYFGNFLVKNQTKKITYAVSMEAIALSLEESNYLKSTLANFSAISVREKVLVEILKPYTSKPLSYVLDPTLVVERDIFDRIAIKPKIMKKYIIIYQVINSSYIYSIAKEIAEQINAEIIEVTSLVKHFIRKENILECLSPEEFLGFIKYSSCILTTSFHGTAFSIIFERPFFSFISSNQNSRINNLLEQLNLEDRIILRNEKIIYSSIDFDSVNALLEQKRDESKLYLKLNLVR
jgi:hypothetical protein